MKRTIFLLWLFLFLTTTTAQEFEPPVIIDPPNPMVGDTIRVGVFHTFFPPCLDLPGTNQDGLTHLFETNINDIELYVVNGPLLPICFPFPVTPAPREFYEIVALEEGTYSLNTFIVDMITPLPIPPNGNFFPLHYGSEITFTVRAPIIISTHNGIGLLLLFLIILTITKHRLNSIKNH